MLHKVFPDPPNCVQIGAKQIAIWYSGQVGDFLKRSQAPVSEPSGSLYLPKAIGHVLRPFSVFERIARRGDGEAAPEFSPAMSWRLRKP